MSLVPETASKLESQKTQAAAVENDIKQKQVATSSVPHAGNTKKKEKKRKATSRLALVGSEEKEPAEKKKKRAKLNSKSPDRDNKKEEEPSPSATGISKQQTRIVYQYGTKKLMPYSYMRPSTCVLLFMDETTGKGFAINCTDTRNDTNNGVAGGGSTDFALDRIHAASIVQDVMSHPFRLAKNKTAPSFNQMRTNFPHYQINRTYRKKNGFFIIGDSSYALLQNEDRKSWCEY